MIYPILDEVTLQKKIYETISEIGIGVVFNQPSADSAFPVFVMQTPLSTPRDLGAAWNITITVEVWGNKHFDADGIELGVADYFTLLKQKMLGINFQCTGQTPMFTDVLTNKLRYGGFFETRWNAYDNTFERTR